MFALARVHPRQFVEFRNFPGHLHWQAGRIKTRNALYSGLARQNGAAESFFANAVGADHAHAGDDDARNRGILQFVGTAFLWA